MSGENGGSPFDKKINFGLAGLVTNKSFEEFATQHHLHHHCAVCGYCILDTRWQVLNLYPVWCVKCREYIKSQTPKGRNLPWSKYGIEFM